MSLTGLIDLVNIDLTQRSQSRSRSRSSNSQGIFSEEDTYSRYLLVLTYQLAPMAPPHQPSSHQHRSDHRRDRDRSRSPVSPHWDLNQLQFLYSHLQGAQPVLWPPIRPPLEWDQASWLSGPTSTPSVPDCFTGASNGTDVSSTASTLRPEQTPSRPRTPSPTPPYRP